MRQDGATLRFVAGEQDKSFGQQAVALAAERAYQHNSRRNWAVCPRATRGSASRCTSVRVSSGRSTTDDTRENRSLDTGARSEVFYQPTPRHRGVGAIARQTRRSQRDSGSRALHPFGSQRVRQSGRELRETAMLMGYARVGTKDQEPPPAGRRSAQRRRIGRRCVSAQRSMSRRFHFSRFTHAYSCGGWTPRFRLTIFGS
jgi:hypothetical protein